MSRVVRLLFSALSGVLLSLAWLGFPGWILFVAFLPLLFVESYLTAEKQRFKSVVFWSHSLFAFLIWNGLTTWWIAHATLAGAVMAIVVNSFLMSVVWWLGHIARRNFYSILGYISLILFWISFEFFHYHWDIEWPWLNLGNGFANSVKIVQWYEFTGVLGGTLWTLVVNMFLYSLIVQIIKKMPIKHMAYNLAFSILVIVIPVLWSIWRYNSYTENIDPVNLVIVQPNIDPYDEAYDMKAEVSKMHILTGLAEKSIDTETDLIVGPETVFERFPDWNVDMLDSSPIFTSLKEWLTLHPDASLIFGTSTCKLYTDLSEATVTARQSHGTYYDVYNSALFVDRYGKHDIYHKSVLVSGVEKMPFRKYLGFLNDLVFNLGGTTGSLGQQDEPQNFMIREGLQVAPVICYESVFGDYLRKFIHKGAGLIVVITNDGWWKNTPGYKQHLSFARLRAIETRRSVARSANTGISALINQRGDFIVSSTWWEEDVLKGTLNANDKETFYVKYGDYIARVALFTSVMLLLLLLVKKLRNGKKKSAPIPF